MEYLSERGWCKVVACTCHFEWFLAQEFGEQYSFTRCRVLVEDMLKLPDYLIDQLSEYVWNETLDAAAHNVEWLLFGKYEKD